MPSATIGSGGVQAIRRRISGVRRFSTGMLTNSDSSARAFLTVTSGLDQLAELGRLTPLAANPLDLLAATLAEKLPGLFPNAAANGARRRSD